jgi:hypothetical protein
MAPENKRKRRESKCGVEFTRSTAVDRRVVVESDVAWRGRPRSSIRIHSQAVLTVKLWPRYKAIAKSALAAHQSSHIALPNDCEVGVGKRGLGS